MPWCATCDKFLNPASVDNAGSCPQCGEAVEIGEFSEDSQDEVKVPWPLRVGLHTCYNGIYNRKQDCEVKQIPKRYLSSDCTLQLECMKLELLVIVDQRATVNTFPGLVHTARHAMGVGST